MEELVLGAQKKSVAGQPRQLVLRLAAKGHLVWQHQQRVAVPDESTRAILFDQQIEAQGEEV